MENPFKIGQQAPPEFDEMLNDWFNNDTPYSETDADDFINYGIRGNVIESEGEAQRLFEQYLKFLKNKEQ